MIVKTLGNFNKTNNDHIKNPHHMTLEEIIE